MKISRSHKIRLKPNNKQITYFKKACGISRFTWNWGLAEWKRRYEAGEKPTGFDLKKYFNQIKNDLFPWTREVLRDANSQPFTTLSTAFNRFFKGQGKYPRFKKKGVKDSFYIANDQFKIKDDKIRIPKLGWVRMREKLRFEGKILSATVSCRGGKWFAAINLEIEASDPVSENQAAVGVDLGVKSLAVLSTGKVVTGPKPHKALLSRLRRLNKSLSRKVKGSGNWKKAKLKLSRLHARIADIRKDALHKLTSEIVGFGVIGIEDLNVRGMTANRRLARSILDMGFHEFRRQLDYKAVATGAKMVVAGRFFPSTKLCSQCGSIQDMPLGQRQYVCGCGFNCDHDLNAAVNLKNMAVGSTVTARGQESSGATALAVA